MGFLFSLSCVAAYKLTGNERAKKAALLAADHLASRYREKGKFLQAWGIYGIALSYRYTKEEGYKDLFYRVTDYFVEHLPEDLIPYWDFDFDTGSEEYRDFSAAAIAVCGMLEMVPHLDKERAIYYKNTAERMLHALITKCGNTDLDRSNGLLLHRTYARASKYNTCRNRGVDECNIWGDYFYMEALMRNCKEWNPYW